MHLLSLLDVLWLLMIASVVNAAAASTKTITTTITKTTTISKTSTITSTRTTSVTSTQTPVVTVTAKGSTVTTTGPATSVTSTSVKVVTSTSTATSIVTQSVTITSTSTATSHDTFTSTTTQSSTITQQPSTCTQSSSTASCTPVIEVQFQNAGGLPLDNQYLSLTPPGEDGAYTIGGADEAASLVLDSSTGYLYYAPDDSDTGVYLVAYPTPNSNASPLYFMTASQAANYPMYTQQPLICELEGDTIPAAGNIDLLKCNIGYLGQFQTSSNGDLQSGLYVIYGYQGLDLIATIKGCDGEIPDVSK